MMTKRILSLIVGIALLAVVQTAGWAQFLGEQQAAMNMADTLNNTSTGPSPGVINRVRNDLGQPAPGSANRNQGGNRAVAAPVEAGGTSFPSTASEVQPATPSADDEDGIPFSLNTATQFANQGMAALRSQRFNEAVEAYRQAMESDPRYEGFYKKVLALRDQVNDGKLQEAQQEKVTVKSDVTWQQFLGWDRPEQGQYMAMPGMQGMPGMPGMMPGMPGMSGVDGPYRGK